MTVTVVVECKVPAFTENVAEVELLEILVEEGTDSALEFELERDTTTPPFPAGVVKVTVANADCPLRIVDGLIASELSVGAWGLTLSPAVTITPE